MTDTELKKLISEGGTKVLNDDERKNLKGSFIQLPCGNTHYELKGEGEAVVLVHGYATPYVIYEKVFNTLVEKGYRVLRYDLMGRGLSERVKADYSAAFFAAQLKQLTEALLGDEPFFLFGTSMGGSVTTAFCAAYPDRVKKLVLLAPAGMDTFRPPFYMKLCSLPLLGDLLFSMIANGTLLKKCASEMTHCTEEEKDYFMREFAQSIKYKGFPKCTLYSLRNTILNTKADTEGYKLTAKAEIPTLCIWGTEDKTMPYYQTERFMEIMPEAELITFENSGHVFVYDEGEKTMEAVLPFLEK